jgi:DNA-binding SARP family transcriptional activator
MRIKLIGRFSLLDEGGHEVKVNNKIQELLTYLCFSDLCMANRGTLSEVLWDNMSEERARHNLRQQLTLLKKNMNGNQHLLHYDNRTIRLNRDNITCDLWELNQIDRNNIIDFYDRSRTDYIGEILDGYNSRSNSFNNWLRAKRLSFRIMLFNIGHVTQESLGALNHRTLARILSGSYRLLEVDPLDEQTNKRVIQILSMQSRKADAYLHYKQYCQLLHDELNESASFKLEDVIPLNIEQGVSQSGLNTPVSLSDSDFHGVVMVMMYDKTLFIDVTKLVQDWNIRVFREQNKLFIVFGWPFARGDEVLSSVSFALGLPSKLMTSSGVFIDAGKVHHSWGKNGVTFSGSIIDKLAELDNVVGSLFISHAIYKSLSNKIIVRGRHSFYGDAGTYWEVESLLSESPALVGRSFELNQFKSALTVCRDESYAAIIQVRGDAGIGKTQFLRQLGEVCVDEQVLPIQVFGSKYHNRTRSQPLTQLLAGILQYNDVLTELSDELSPVVNELLDLPLDEGACAYIESLKWEKHYQLKVDALKLAMLETSKNNAVCVIVDDMHWYDTETVSVFFRLANELIKCSILFVYAVRNDNNLPSSMLDAVIDELPVITVELPLLNAVDGERLARMHGGEYADHALIARSLERSKGHPLFLEQLLLAGESNPAKLPVQIHQIVQSRLDSLTAKQLSILEVASIFYRKISIEALNFLGFVRYNDIEILVRMLLLKEVPGGYIFCHDLVRDSIYERLPGKRKLALHARLAVFYQSKHAVPYAYHLYKSNSEHSAESCLKAAKHLLIDSDFKQALEFVEFSLVGRISEEAQSLKLELNDRLTKMEAPNESIHHVESN